MSRQFFIFRALIVIATAGFMAYHTQLFICHIEPNLIFSWTASLLIEAMIISAAISKGWVRLWLIPLYLISVLTASASFWVRNEGTFEQYFEGKEAQAQTGQVVEVLKQDLATTQKDFERGDKYTTKTVQRQRAIQDRLEQVLLTAKGQTGHMAVYNSLLFLVLVFVLQGVSVSTAWSLKAGISRGNRTAEAHKPSQQVSKFPVLVSTETTETETMETTETRKQGNGNHGNHGSGAVNNSEMERGALENPAVVLDKAAIVAAVQKLKGDGARFDALAADFGVSKGTLSKLTQYPQYQVSDEIFLKVRDILLRKNGNQ